MKILWLPPQCVSINDQYCVSSGLNRDYNFICHQWKNTNTEVKMDESNANANDSISTSALLDARDVNASEMEMMKGDTIGDTIYSAKWIINVLMSLSNVPEKGWSEALETELCLLWDMTVEKDVALFLYENNFLKITESLLHTSDNPRMIEITIGILGNICCQPSIILHLAECKEFVAALFNLLTIDDTETLIQLLRLLRVTVWDITANPDSLWLDNLNHCPILAESLIFILNSSTNDNLLTAAIDLLQSISAVEVGQEILLRVLFNGKQLVSALLESYTQMIPKQDGSHTRSELKFIDNWLQILSTIIDLDLCICTDDHSNQTLTNILHTLLRILQPFMQSHNLIPLDEPSAVCIHECVKLILRFQQNHLPVGSEIVFIIVTIMYHLKSRNVTTEEEYTDDNAEELLKYLEQYWLHILDMYDSEQLQDILLMCEKNIVSYIMNMSSSDIKLAGDKIHKLTIADVSMNQ